MAEPANSELEANFFDAVKNGKVDRVKTMVAEVPELLQAFDHKSFGGPALNLVVLTKNREMIDVLMDVGADPNLKSDWWAGPWNATQCALNCGFDDLAEYFVKRGATLGTHEAAGLSRLEELATLLDESPDRVHERGGDGCSPLHFAGSVEAADLLAARGADLDARDVDHFSTPAQYLAKNRPEVARHLFRLGATPDIFSAILAGDIDSVRQLTAADPGLLEARINQEMFPPGPEHDVHNVMTFTVGMHSTPLHAAASAGRLELIDALLAAGIDVDIRGGYDESSSLHKAAWNDDLVVAKKLIAAGADLNLRSGEIHNNTPAGWAIVAGSADVFCFLLDCGAEVPASFYEAAQAAVDGQFRQLKVVPQENYRRIFDRLNG